MAEVFFGDWTVEVFENESAFRQRFVIDQSAASDGVYPGATSTAPVSVSGRAWHVTLEWNNDSGSGWQPSEVRRSVSYTVQDGLVTFLGGDDNFEQFRDHDFNDVILRCRSADSKLTPWHPIVNPFDFT